MSISVYYRHLYIPLHWASNRPFFCAFCVHFCVRFLFCYIPERAFLMQKRGLKPLKQPIFEYILLIRTSRIFHQSIQKPS